MEKINLSSEFSLLYPPDSVRPPARDGWSEHTVADLGLDEIVNALNISTQYIQAIKAILLELPGEARVISYRQQILADFLNGEGVLQSFEELLPMLGNLHDSALTSGTGTVLQQTLGRLAELNTYVKCVKKLRAGLAAADSDLHSQGLCALRDLLEHVEADETFQSLAQELPELLSRLNSVPSITIGINLDNELFPVGATLLAVHDKPFRGGSLLDRLLGRKASQKPDQGIGPLHELPYQEVADGRVVVQLPTRLNPRLVPLFRDLHEVLRSVIAPIHQALTHYAQVNARFLIPLESEIAFYLGAAALVQRMRASGLPVCCPEARPQPDRICRIQGLYNLRLAQRLAAERPGTRLEQAMVLNDVDFGPEGRVFILTGPNQGGKTIYTQAVGLAQILFQAGLYVPAAQAQMSPVDGVYTHFATLEKTELGLGRLGEESKRLNEIFQSVTDHSLVLLNESLSSTSPGESLYLSQDIVRALRLYGTRAIFATHLHELAEGLEAINAEVPGDSRVASLVAGTAEEGHPETGADPVTRTYKISAGPPKGLSYAKGVAARYGISFEQLANRWRERTDGSGGEDGANRRIISGEPKL